METFVRGGEKVEAGDLVAPIGRQMVGDLASQEATATGDQQTHVRPTRDGSQTSPVALGWMGAPVDTTGDQLSRGRTSEAVLLGPPGPLLVHGWKPTERHCPEEPSQLRGPA
jgi:hypothetical protein